LVVALTLLHQVARLDAPEDVPGRASPRPLVSPTSAQPAGR